MTSNLELKLRLAQPHLIASIEFMEPEPRTARIRPYTRQSDPGWDELVDEGYDPNGPMGPTYWRIVRRGRERLYLSTAFVRRDAVVKGWGLEGLPYCDPQTGTAPIRLETLLERQATQ
jgi:hypothetical protein